MSKAEIFMLGIMLGMLIAFVLVLMFEFYASPSPAAGTLYGLVSTIL